MTTKADTCRKFVVPRLHLKALIGVGLVSQTREGTTLVCHTNYGLMRGLIDYLVEECCTEGTCAPGILPNKAA